MERVRSLQALDSHAQISPIRIARNDASKAKEIEETLERWSYWRSIEVKKRHSHNTKTPEKDVFLRELESEVDWEKDRAYSKGSCFANLRMSMKADCLARLASLYKNQSF
ncbi:unnamed protein product [Owenia fusiformis]|uniref:Uncharacterized protein n=1 Tax=Owenia fusiformis TaxID=6347 RepID=A0A8J1U1A9_OWEFU|nr:unnamed protein product [Owenia fusiformis]